MLTTRELRCELNVLNSGGRWAMAAPIYHFANVFGRPLDYHLNSLVGKVPHPSRYTKLFCDVHRGLPEHHALNIATYQQANPRKSYRVLTHVATPDARMSSSASTMRPVEPRCVGSTYSNRSLAVW
jgi:hypothetical protein